LQPLELALNELTRQQVQARRINRRLQDGVLRAIEADELAAHGFQYVCIGKPHVPQSPVPIAAKEFVVSPVMVSGASPQSAPTFSASAQVQP